MVFEALVVKEPTERDKARGKLEEIVYGPLVVVAKDKEQARLLAIQKAKLSDEEVTRIAVLVRGF